MKHYVLGGAGFIGSHLVDALEGERVVIDNFSRGNLRNLFGAMTHGGVSLSPADLDYQRPEFEEDSIIWALAAKVTGIEYNRHNQYDMLVKNMRIIHNMVEAARKAKPKLFVYVSTACIYPHDAPVPTPEEAGDIGNPEPTNHGYGVAKWLGEQMVRHLHKEHNCPCLIVRFFNAFGPRDYYDEATSHVAPALIRRVMEGEDPVMVWGSGNQTRALVDARDIAKALVMLGEKIPTCGWTDAPIFNIGHEREITIRELAETILRLSGSDAELVFDTSKPDGYARRAADTTRLRKFIGWVPDTPLEETLADMIAEYKRGESHL